MVRRNCGGGVDLARLLLRGAIGGTMIAHGVRHGRTLEGTARWFSSMGFRKPELQARLSAAMEVGTGAAILLGAGTPLAGSAVVGTMAVAAQTVHRPNGYFVVKDGWEYVAFVATSTTALSALGPGRLSLDRLLRLDERGTGPKRAALTVAVGLAGAAAQLKLFWTKPDPS